MATVAHFGISPRELLGDLFPLEVVVVPQMLKFFVLFLGPGLFDLVVAGLEVVLLGEFNIINSVFRQIRIGWL